MRSMECSDLMATRWTSQRWRTDAEAWIRAELDRAGLTLVGPLEQSRVHPWSTHLVAPTSEGCYWFKESCPVLWFEVGLMDVLSRLVPGRVLEPLAIDVGRGWMLTPDGGPVMDTQATVESFGRALADFAFIQRDVADNGPKLVAGGLDRRPVDDTAGHFEDQLVELVDLPVIHPLRVDPEVLTASARRKEVIDEAVERLAEVPVPESLQHNDLHPRNIFAQTGGSTRFFDFGDAVWSHPFCVLDVALHRISQQWNCPRTDDRLVRLVDMYLDPWTDLAPRRTLRTLIAPAMTIARFHRYNSWHQLIPFMPIRELQRHAGYAQSLAMGVAKR